MKKKFALLIGMVLIGSLALVGCGGSEDKPASGIEEEYDEYEDEDEEYDEDEEEQEEQEAEQQEAEQEGEEAVEVDNLEGSTWLLMAMIDEAGVAMEGEALQEAVGSMAMEFHSDGVLIIFVGEESEEGTWVQTGEQFTIVSEGTPSNGAITNNIMAIDSTGTKMIFEKQ